MSEQVSEISSLSEPKSRDLRIVVPSPMVILLAMFSGAAFLYLLLPTEMVPVYASGGNLTTVALAAAGVVCAIYGWSSILGGDKK